MTELDDLKSTWQTLNRNLERQHALALRQFRETKLKRFHSEFRPLLAGQIIQLTFGVILAVIGGGFWVDHLGVVRPMIYGISLHAYGLMLIVLAARDLFLIRRIDYAAPVLELQKHIAELRGWHLRTAPWLAVAGGFIWIPTTLMLFYWMGIDVWPRYSNVVVWCLLSSFVYVGVLYGIVFSLRRSGGKIAKSLGAEGHTVRRAEALLDEIERFERA